MKKSVTIIFLLSIISMGSIITNVYQYHKHGMCVKANIVEIENIIRHNYLEDLKMLSSQLVNSKNHFDTLNQNFKKIGNDYLIEIMPKEKGEYGSIELSNILITFDTLGYAEKIYLANDSILKEN